MQPSVAPDDSPNLIEPQIEESKEENCDDFEPRPVRNIESQTDRPTLMIPDKISVHMDQLINEGESLDGSANQSVKGATTAPQTVSIPQVTPPRGRARQT